MPLMVQARVEYRDQSIVVDAQWSGEQLDRPISSGFRLPAHAVDMVARLVRAINAQAVYENPQVLVDVNGHTFVGAKARVMGRRMNADLRRLGF